jgi:hypothetical protein
MIFGDPKDVAIEAYHEPSGPQWAGCGRLCLHVHGVQVGDIQDNHCSLFAVTDRLRHLSKVIKDLWAECFAGLSDAEVFRLIDRDIYSDDPPSELGSGFEDFDFLTNSAEMFDGTKTFVFCHPDGLVHILCQFRDDTFGSGSCSVETFRSVATAYIQWFDEQVRTTAPPYFPINPFDLNEKVPDNRDG